MNIQILTPARWWPSIERETIAHAMATAALVAALGVGTAAIVGGANNASAAEARSASSMPIVRWRRRMRFA